MNIDEKMEMVMANEEVKNLSYKEKRAARPAFFLPHQMDGQRGVKRKEERPLCEGRSLV
jgi:hypothetical protein